MKYKVVSTKQADNDLRAVYEYIAFTLLVPEVAAGQLNRIEKAIMKLDGQNLMRDENPEKKMDGYYTRM